MERSDDEDVNDTPIVLEGPIQYSKTNSRKSKTMDNIQKYCSKVRPHPALDCKLEGKIYGTLDDLVRSVPKGHIPSFRDAVFKCNICEHIGDRPRRLEQRSNSVIVVSLKHGPFAVIFDWICNKC